MDFGSNVVVDRPTVAHPGPLGLAATGVANYIIAVQTTGWNQGYDTSIGIALFYGGLAQFVAGLWEFRRNNTLGALAFTTYGAWWVGSVVFNVLFTDAANFSYYLSGTNLGEMGSWFTLSIFIMNTFMLIASVQTGPVSVSVFTFLELSELSILIGQFLKQKNGQGWIAAGGYFQVILAICCFYGSFGITFNEMAGREIIPMGKPLMNLKKEEKDV